MYIEKPAELHIEHAKLQFHSNFSGLNGFKKPKPGDPLKRDLSIKIEVLEQAEQLAALGWPVKIYYRGPRIESDDPDRAIKLDKIAEVRTLAKRCLNFDELRSFYISRDEYSTEFISFYIPAKIQWHDNDSYLVKYNPIIYEICPVQKTYVPMTELNVGRLDNCKFLDLDLYLNASWNSDTNAFTAYLKRAEVVIDENPCEIAFAQKYSDFRMVTEEDE